MNVYVAGNKVRVSISLTDETLVPPALADPATVTMVFEAAGTGMVTKYTWPTGGGEIVHDGTGQFHVDLDTTGSTSGVWQTEVVTTGVQAAAVLNFAVTALPLPAT